MYFKLCYSSHYYLKIKAIIKFKISVFVLIIKSCIYLIIRQRGQKTVEIKTKFKKQTFN